MITDYHNIHKGDVCIIVGTGPSLRSVPRSFLDSHITFGQNKCYLNQTPLEHFTPTYYVTSDPDHDIDRLAVDLLNCVKFTRENTGFRNTNEFRVERTKVFSKHPDLFVYEGYSVTFISLQLAYYMGFATVLLVGCDHRYKPYKAGVEKDPNHYAENYEGKTNFDPRSLAKGEREIPASMELARTAFEADGRKVINLTPNSNLKVFPMGRLEDWL